MRSLIVLALLAAAPTGKAPAGCAYPAELSAFRLCPSAPWRTLQPLASTAAEVRAALGTPTDARDVAAYLDPYPGDDRAEQPVLTFDGGPDWQILVYFVRSGLADRREYPKALYDKLLSIDLVPRHRVPMGQVTFPPGFEKKHVIAADAAWDLYRHPSGLAYEVYTTRTPYGGEQPGDLNRISYGPSDEAKKRSAVRAGTREVRACPAWPEPSPGPRRCCHWRRGGARDDAFPALAALRRRQPGPLDAGSRAGRPGRRRAARRLAIGP